MISPVLYFWLSLMVAVAAVLAALKWDANGWDRTRYGVIGWWCLSIWFVLAAVYHAIYAGWLPVLKPFENTYLLCHVLCLPPIAAALVLDARERRRQKAGGKNG